MEEEDVGWDESDVVVQDAFISSIVETAEKEESDLDDFQIQDLLKSHHHPHHEKKGKEEGKHHHHPRQRRHHPKKGDAEDGPSEKVKVIVRSRPLSEKETLQGHSKIIQITEDGKGIEVRRPNPTSLNIVNAKGDKVFTFDAVYDERTSQGELYEEAFSDLVDSVLEGFNGTIFAYGQTGTGKTYTMEGIRDIRAEQGVIPNAFRQIFDRIHDSPDQTYLVRASYLEIYQEELKDLLNPKLKICEVKENSDGLVYIKGLTSFLCRDFNEINKLMSKGNAHRSTGATNMNEHSSRSHAVFMIAVEMSEKWDNGESHVRVGRLNLVDLAGSERQGKTGAEGERLKEAVKINLSLSALGNVIGALADGKSGHIPYRDSKLTRLLQDSLGGNSRTVMVATIGPASYNYDETMTTLRYASRAKRIKNKPKVNEDPKDAMLRNYQLEIAKLRALLDAKYNGLGPPSQAVEGDGDSGRRRPITGQPVNSLFDASLVSELEPYLENHGLGSLNDPKAILKILEEKRTALLTDTATAQEEKERLLTKLESTHRKVEQVEEDCGKLHDRVEWLESKVLNGDKTLLDQTTEQERLIEERQDELDKEKAAEDQMRGTIEEHHLTVKELQDLRAALEITVAYEQKRFRRLQAKVFKAKEDRAERMSKHRYDVAKLQRYLIHNQKENQRNLVILENFVPARMERFLESLARPNDDNTFSFLPVTSILLPRPLVNRMGLFPLYYKSFTGVVYPRPDLYYTDENVLQVHPLPGIRRTKPYVPPDTDPHIKSVMTRALAEAEKEVRIDCVRINSLSKQRRAKTARVRLGEILISENNMSVRQVLSAKHRTREIPYKDFVAVTPTRGSSSAERRQSGAPFTNQLRRTNHVSLSPNFLHAPPTTAAPLTPTNHRVSPSSPPCNPRPNTPIYPFDPFSEETRTNSESTNPSSLRNSQDGMQKRKKPSPAGAVPYSRLCWANSLYEDPPPPPCTAVHSGHPKLMTSRIGGTGSGWRNDLTRVPPPTGVPCPRTPNSSNPPDARYSVRPRFGREGKSAEEVLPFREARHFGAGTVRRDPITSRANCYPPGVSYPPNRTTTNSSGFSRGGGKARSGLEDFDSPSCPWETKTFCSEARGVIGCRKSLPLSSPPPPTSGEAVGKYVESELSSKFTNHRRHSSAVPSRYGFGSSVRKSPPHHLLPPFIFKPIRDDTV